MQLHKDLCRALVITLAFCSLAEAAEWSTEPSITLRTGYNDNIRLTSADHDSVLENAVSPSIKFGVAKENQGLFLNTGFSIRRFTGGSGRESGSVLDREDYTLNLAAYRGYEKNTLRSTISYKRDSTLDSELDETGNVIEDRATRDLIVLSPSWERRLSEKMTMGLTYQFRNIGYSDDPGISDLIEYDYHVLAATLDRTLTPRLIGNIDVTYSIYKPESDIDSTTLNIQAGVTRQFNKTLKASFLAGQRHTKSDSLVPAGFCFGGGGTFPSCMGGTPIQTGTSKDEFESDGLVFSASIKKTLETGSLTASLSRSSSPAADGDLLDATRLQLSGSHNFSRNFQASLTFDFTERETIVNRSGTEVDEDSETFFRVKPAATYRWSRAVYLSGYYEYARNENPSLNDASRNAVYLNLGYEPTKSTRSR